MNLWIKENWDKILGYAISIVVAAVVGFFSAIRATDSEISDLRTRLVALETDSENLIKPKLNFIDTNRLTIESLSLAVDSVSQQNEIHKATFNLLSLTREETKRETINELKELLGENANQ